MQWASIHRYARMGKICTVVSACSLIYSLLTVASLNCVLDLHHAPGFCPKVALGTGVVKPANMSKSGEVRYTIEQMYEILQNSNTKSVLKKCLTPAVISACKGKKTKWGGTIERCINSGVEQLDSKVGCHFSDPEAHVLFAPLMDPVVKMYHKVEGEIQHPPCDFGDVHNLPFGNLDPERKYIISTRARVGRSVDGFAYAPILSYEDRKEIENLGKRAYGTLTDELAGSYYPLTGMSKEREQQLIKDHYLFKTDDKFHISAGANRDWPDGRGIYLGDANGYGADKIRFLSWCNEADHFRFISMQPGGDLGEVYRRLVRAVGVLGKTIPFARSDKYGFLTYCPSNLGTTLRASVHAKIPLLSVNQEMFKAVCEKYNIQARGVYGEHTQSVGGVFDLSNKRRLGLSEIAAVTEMATGVKAILELERQLENVKKSYPNWEGAVRYNITQSYEILQKSDTKSVLKKCLTPDVINACAGRKTKYGGTLERCINSGVEHLDSKLGCHFTDPEAHELFVELFDPVIRMYHMVPDGQPIQHPPCNFGDVNNLPFGNLDPEGKYVLSTRARVGRSFEGLPYAPVISYEDRMKIQERALAAYNALPDELAGTYYPLTGMSKQREQQLIKDHYLFKTDDKFHIAAAANRDWPDGRGIFLGDRNGAENIRFLSWCNEADHFRFISMQPGGDLGQVYKRLVRAVDLMNKSIPFARSDKYGYLTYCPSNLGTTLRASVHAKIPKLSSNLEQFKAICAKYNIQARGVYGEHTASQGGVFDLSNKRRLGLTELEAVTEMAKGVTAIIELEKSL